jgi:hypothetical protein
MDGDGCVVLDRDIRRHVSSRLWMVCIDSARLAHFRWLALESHFISLTSSLLLVISCCYLYNTPPLVSTIVAPSYEDLPDPSSLS